MDAYKCAHCKTGFSNLAMLKKHYKFCASRPKKQKCKHCGAKFYYKYELHNHENAIHPPLFRFSQ